MYDHSGYTSRSLFLPVEHVYTPVDHVGIKQAHLFSIDSEENNMTETVGC